MNVDWFTFVAQVFNFVILVFLLKRFLYRPVLDTIARREESIRSRLEEARRKEETAEVERQELRERQAELESRRSALLKEAEDEAEERRKALTRDVRAHVEKVREEWRASLRRQQETFLEELRRRIASETYHLVARVVRDLADAELEDRVLGVFLERLQASEEAERREVLAALAKSGGRIGILSALPLTAERQNKIGQAVRAWTGGEPELHFEDDPELALGIEMRVGDRKVGWSVGSYLEALESETSRYLTAESG